MSKPRKMPLQARYIRADVCPAGCPLIILSDADDREIAVAHIDPADIEPLIAQLREAASLGAARRRPVS